MLEDGQFDDSVDNMAFCDKLVEELSKLQQSGNYFRLSPVCS